jgi:PPOX class probable F420-dependent enzyme
VPAHPMTDDERRAFLCAVPARTGKLATVRADGRPHVAPVWYALDGDDIVFMTGRTTVKGRNLAHRGWASFCVDDDRPPFSFVVMEGPVEIDEDLSALVEWGTRIGGRYMGAERAEEFGRRNGVPGELLVRIRTEKIHALMDLSD